jgi:hypothetical protein
MKLPDLSGKTVAVIGGAPGATVPPADYVIAASSGLCAAPTADMLVMIDGKLPPHCPETDTAFTGLRVVGIPVDHADALYIPLPYEVARGVHFRNNGISAIRIAAGCGAKRIVLSGFDPDAYDAFNSEFGYAGLTATALPALIAELAGRGVTVEFYTPPVVKSRKPWTSGN